MTAPNSGTYDGILFYQDRRAAAGTTNSVNGNSSSLLSGAFYFPRPNLDINGTSNLDLQLRAIRIAQGRLLGQRQHQQHDAPHGYGANRDHRQSCEAGRMTRHPHNPCSRLPRCVDHRTGACGPVHGDADHRHGRYQPRLFRQGWRSTQAAQRAIEKAMQGSNDHGYLYDDASGRRCLGCGRR